MSNTNTMLHFILNENFSNNRCKKYFPTDPFDWVHDAFLEQSTNDPSIKIPAKIPQELIFDELNSCLIFGIKKITLSEQQTKFIKVFSKTNPQRVETILNRVFEKKYKFKDKVKPSDRNLFDTAKCKLNKECHEKLGLQELIKRYGKLKYGLAVEIKQK